MTIHQTKLAKRLLPKAQVNLGYEAKDAKECIQNSLVHQRAQARLDHSLKSDSYSHSHQIKGSPCSTSEITKGRIGSIS